ncbi:MAG: YHS domain-containing protein [Pseudomonadales bacterium]|nr:YHS domain-containing protein [Pseudomonadales bacterium]
MKKILLVLMLFWAANVFAGDAIYTSYFSNNAVGGYDTVAYFTEGKPLKGNSKYSTSYKKTKWLFSSAENLALFKADPSKYAPQYGGFCAWAVAAKNSRASGDPLRWNIVNDKLYLNYDKDIQQQWKKDIPGFIVKADINWPKLLNN